MSPVGLGPRPTTGQPDNPNRGIVERLDLSSREGRYRALAQLAEGMANGTVPRGGGTGAVWAVKVADGLGQPEPERPARGKRARSAAGEPPPAPPSAPDPPVEPTFEQAIRAAKAAKRAPENAA